MKFEDFLGKMQRLIDEARKQNAFHEFVESNDKNKPKGGIVKECFNEGNGYYKVNLAYLNEEQVKEIEGLVKKWNPELSESEDERIRKAIHIYFDWLDGRKDYAPRGEYTIRDMIAWLKNQGEKPTAWSEEDEDIMYNIISNLTELKDRYGEEYGKVGKCIDWLKSLRPQNTWRPSDEQMKAFENFVRGIWESCYDSPYENNAKLLYSLLEQLKKLK